ncbi:hypothetical protein, partial [Maribellus maritimus]|uniref:hypothetical protein n=1 Tax=Maribellus maritimus TaxID=2870838 RepID=UPI001EEBAE9D
MDSAQNYFLPGTSNSLYCSILLEWLFLISNLIWNYIQIQFVLHSVFGEYPFSVLCWVSKTSLNLVFSFQRFKAKEYF